MFKVGEYARVVKIHPSTAAIGLKIGDVVEVLATREGRERPYVIKYSILHGKNTGYCEADCLAPLEWQVGDQAQIIKPARETQMNGFAIGETVRIISNEHAKDRIVDSQGEVKIQAMNSSLIGYFPTTCLAPLSAPARNGIDMITAFARLLKSDPELLADFVDQVEDACDEARQRMAKLLKMSDFTVKKTVLGEQVCGVDLQWTTRMTAEEQEAFEKRLAGMNRPEPTAGELPPVRLRRAGALPLDGTVTITCRCGMKFEVGEDK